MGVLNESRLKKQPLLSFPSVGRTDAWPKRLRIQQSLVNLFKGFLHRKNLKLRIGAKDTDVQPNEGNLQTDDNVRFPQIDYWNLR